MHVHVQPGAFLVSAHIKYVHHIRLAGLACDCLKDTNSHAHMVDKSYSTDYYTSETSR